eukprot:jgi/Botrbrau1/726/Bobra.160_2s0049.1
MGKKKPIILKVLPQRRQGKKLECMQELSAFFSCMARNRFDIDSHCQMERSILEKCVEDTAKQVKERPTTNYHLQRLARMLKRR